MKAFKVLYRTAIAPLPLIAVIILGAFALPPTHAHTINQVQNPEFRGNQGAVAGNVTGSIASGWRGFAVAGAEASVNSIELPPGALLAGSPATTAVGLEITDFGVVGSDSGFDHTGWDFSLFGCRKGASITSRRDLMQKAAQRSGMVCGPVPQTMGIPSRRDLNANESIADLCRKGASITSRRDLMQKAAQRSPLRTCAAKERASRPEGI